MNTKLNQLKQQLKDLAKNISIAKQERKLVRFTGTRTIKAPHEYWSSDAAYAAERARVWSTNFRIDHIAYCLIRGKKYEEIERKVKDQNKLTTDYTDLWPAINKTINEYGGSDEQALCASA